MPGLPDHGIRAHEVPLSEWGSGPRRDETSDLARLLASGDAVCASDPVKDRWIDTETRATYGLKKLCMRCPLLDDCREYAMTYDVWGVWGGTTATDRRALRAGTKPEPVHFRPYLEQVS